MIKVTRINGKYRVIEKTTGRPITTYDAYPKDGGGYYSKAEAERRARAVARRRGTAG